MSGPFRLPDGGRIDRNKKVAFSFDGQRMEGCAGDTLASALLANGVHLVGRSFKYHRPRGILSAGAEEPNALVTVSRDTGRTTPNLRATQVELYPGLVAHSQNRWPALGFDVGAVADVASPLLGAGFYYKTFMWPASFWRRLYEPAIRRAAGLGRAPRAPDPDRYLHRYAHCDVLVIGAGAAGLAAALAASAAGARVILCDEQAEFGGALLHETGEIESIAAAEWASEATARLAAHGVVLLPRTTAFGWFPDNLIGLAERLTDHLADPNPRLPRERLWQVRAQQVVIAAGAIERPLVFPDNDRPGIMLADAARCYLHRFGVKVGSRAVVATADDSAYRTTIELHRAGVQIAAIADTRPSPDGEAVAEARATGLDVRTGTVVAGTAGRRRIHSARLYNATGAQTVNCDVLLMSGGWTPSVHLFSQSRGKLRYDACLGAFVPNLSAARERSVGGCNGIYDLAACVEQGYAAGEQAAPPHTATPTPAATPAPPNVTPSPPNTTAGPPTVMAGLVPAISRPVRDAGADSQQMARMIPAVSAAAALRRKAFVDFQNDVAAKDLLAAVGEGFRSVEHVKRYTTTGMATDQGKTSNLNALALVARTLHKPVPAVGHTTFRMPYTPVTFGTFAGSARGEMLDPVRRTPIHPWAHAQGAVFEDVGNWKRARFFPRDGEDMHAAVARECRAVRTTVGSFDASTLGKIEVVGPDAGVFLDRMYTGNFVRLPVGRCRYGLLLNEAGFVLDDGVVARLAPDRFHLTTTTGGAASVLHHMEDYLQTEFPELQVWLTSITEQWAVIAVQGPRARDVIAPLTAGTDIAAEAMPHMSVRDAVVADIPARLFRVSFTGESGYEINVPADHGLTVWQAVLAAGTAHGITPYGTEAMHVLRAEKGYIVVGQETDGTVTPDDLGLGWTIGRTKDDFVGKRSLARPEMLRPDRRQLVGLSTGDPGEVLEEGAQLTTDHGTVSLGRITSSYRSEALGRSIALALVSGGRARRGQTLYVPMPDREIPVTVTDLAFYDREGARLNG